MNVYAMVTVVVLVNCKSSSELCKSLQVKIRWRALLFPIPFPPPPAKQTTTLHHGPTQRQASLWIFQTQNSLHLSSVEELFFFFNSSILSLLLENVALDNANHHHHHHPPRPTFELFVFRSGFRMPSSSKLETTRSTRLRQAPPSPAWRKAYGRPEGQLKPDGESKRIY